jgi:PadR family transcriptional regulator, regulatory protein AphA
MAQHNKTKYAIMALLSEAPRTGYDIKKALEANEIYFWSESYGQIYPILHKLAKEGLAEKRKASTERHPNRTVYELTPSGRAELVEWLKRPAGTIPLRIELLLKLRYGHLIDPANCLKLIGDYRQGQVDDIERLERQLDKHTGDDIRDAYARMTLRYGIALKRALVEWCRGTVDELEALAESEAAESIKGGGGAPDGGFSCGVTLLQL